ncbi:MAG TPA: MmgE/PrpD family protein [Thermomicrobiaceae bacterium]|nr:MmgE/PrpD family protein [Thermomicrobiaceae bacterium]
MTLSGSLADFITATRFADLPDDAVTMARRSVLDWLGSALRGGTTEPARIAREVATRTMPGDEATLLATGGRLSALGAAFVNGAASHVIELDDLHQASTFHPAAPIIPAAVAVAERAGADGRALLRAVVLGYEVGIRIAEAVNPSHYRYWHPTATCGVFGAAAAASALVGLPADQVAHALGSAGTQAGGLWEFLADGAMSKHLHAGMAAHDGILSADLAAAGFTGASRILEGPRGFFAATATSADPTRITEGLGRHFKIVENGFKCHACCGHTHTAVDAALALRERIDGREIASVAIDTYRVALDITDNPAPRTPYEAKFSIQYAVGIGLLDGRAGLEQFDPGRLSAPDIRSLLGTTTARADEALTAGYPATWASRVRVSLAEGTTLEETVGQPKGMPANPLTDDEVAAKYHDLAGPVVGAAAARQLEQAVGRLADGAPLSELTRPLAAQRAAV